MRKINRIANTAVMQTEWRAGKMVNAAESNAAISVADVSVMATPARLIVRAIFSGSDMPSFSSLDSMLLKHCIITNMSSMPTPENLSKRLHMLVVAGKL